MKLLVIGVALAIAAPKRGCDAKSREAEKATDQPIAKPALVADAAVAVVARDAAAPKQTERGTVDERRALAKTYRGQGMLIKTIGPKENILEIGVANGSCNIGDLALAIGSVADEMSAAGFVAVKCPAKEEMLSLVERDGSPLAAVTVGAKKLFAAYDSNEISADSKYKGKPLRVVGKIARIGKDVLDLPYVELAADGYGVNNIHASFKSADALAELKKGQWIAVRGVGHGTSLGSPLLDDCALE